VLRKQGVATLFQGQQIIKSGSLNFSFSEQNTESVSEILLLLCAFNNNFLSKCYLVGHNLEAEDFKKNVFWVVV